MRPGDAEAGDRWAAGGVPGAARKPERSLYAGGHPAGRGGRGACGGGILGVVVDIEAVDPSAPLAPSAARPGSVRPWLILLCFGSSGGGLSLIHI